MKMLGAGEGFCSQLSGGELIRITGQFLSTIRRSVVEAKGALACLVLITHPAKPAKKAKIHTIASFFSAVESCVR